MAAGLRPKLAICAPPQHGKSMSVVDFIAWMSGLNPGLKTMYASYSDMLGIRANTDLQRVYDGPKYQSIFDTRINTANVVTTTRHQRNASILQYLDTGGYFRNTTVMGPCTGEGLDLGVIDDPIKSRAEASSPAIRNKVWMWFLDDFFSRFSNDAGLLWIMTRWHLDDPLGRAIDKFPDLKLIVYPAINDMGEALFPEFKSLEYLQERKGLMTATSWEALYQQNPTPESGRMFNTENIQIVDSVPECTTVRYWDTAGTQGGGCYTAGVKIGKAGANYYIMHVHRGQWAAPERENHIHQAAEIDGKKVRILVEKQGGSSGKEVAEATVKALKVTGFNAEVDNPTGDKVLRAELVTPEVEHGRVFLVRGAWNQAYLDEMNLFPDGKYLDQIDATSGAFKALQKKQVIFF